MDKRTTVSKCFKCRLKGSVLGASEASASSKPLSLINLLSSRDMVTSPRALHASWHHVINCTGHYLTSFAASHFFNDGHFEVSINLTVSAHL